MAYRPVSIDHVNIFVRNAERSLKWYTDVFGFHTQDTMMFPGTNRLRAAFLSCDPGHAHDIAGVERVGALDLDKIGGWTRIDGAGRQRQQHEYQRKKSQPAHRILTKHRRTLGRYG